MSTPDDEFDPDDNYAGHEGADDDAEATVESLVWQLLLLINPDDEDSALQQFQAWQDAMSAFDPDDADAPVLDSLREVIDWRAGFTVEAGDASAFVECLDELAARWNLRIDWGSDDLQEDELDVAALISRAHDQLREHGYTLWTWGVAGQPREEIFSGFITQRHEAEGLELIAPMLGMELRPGSAF
jgi:hypothetical protein